MTVSVPISVLDSSRTMTVRGRFLDKAGTIECLRTLIALFLAPPIMHNPHESIFY